MPVNRSAIHAEVEPPLDRAPSGAVRVIVVDDDEAVRFATTLLVESCGWTAVSYASAEEFLAADVRPDASTCLVLDLNMPGLSGADLLDRLDADRRWLPVIVVTGFADSPLAARARGSGVRAVLKKPFRDQLLLDHIRQALNLDR